MMESQVLEQVRESLSEKRSTLAEWLRTTPAELRRVRLGPAGEEAVQSHVAVLETAVEKASAGTLGVCSVCHEYVESDLLEMDYTASVCLAHLSAREIRNLEYELELAQTVQRSLLPQQVPDTSALDIAAFSRPAQIVGGDYFDFFRFLDGAHGLAVADVAGHGISASLYMASVQALLRTLIPANASPAAVVEHLHRLLIHNVRFSTFVTLFLAAFDPATHCLTYCNAGHNPQLVVHGEEDGGQQVRWLWPTGAAIGLVEESAFGVESVRLNPGDILLLYTDGVTEAEDRHGQGFGRERLAEVVRHTRHLPARDLLRAIRQELEWFSGGQPPADDITLVVCNIAG